MKTLDEYEKEASRRVLDKYPEGVPINLLEITHTMTQLIMIDLGNVLLKKK